MSQLQTFLKKLWFYKTNIIVPSLTAFLIYSDRARTKRYKERKKLEAAGNLADRVKGMRIIEPVSAMDRHLSHYRHYRYRQS